MGGKLEKTCPWLSKSYDEDELHLSDGTITHVEITQQRAATSSAASISDDSSSSSRDHRHHHLPANPRVKLMRDLRAQDLSITSGMKKIKSDLVGRGISVYIAWNQYKFWSCGPSSL
jgi:hypothetical protein